MIDAYLKGKQDGLEQQQRLIIEKLVSNINKAGKDTSSILSYLRTLKLNPISAYLKINSWDDFAILVILPQEDFLDSRMLSAYEYITDFEKKVADEMYHIQVTICDTEDTIDENYVRSDGFTLKHKVGK